MDATQIFSMSATVVVGKDDLSPNSCLVFIIKYKLIKLHDRAVDHCEVCTFDKFIDACFL